MQSAWHNSDHGKNSGLPHSTPRITGAGKLVSSVLSVTKVREALQRSLRGGRAADSPIPAGVQGVSAWGLESSSLLGAQASSLSAQGSLRA